MRSVSAFVAGLRIHVSIEGPGERDNLTFFEGGGGEFQKDCSRKSTDSQFTC